MQICHEGIFSAYMFIHYLPAKTALCDIRKLNRLLMDCAVYFPERGVENGRY